MTADSHSPRPEPTWCPAVTIIMPVLDEELHLAEAVGAALGQDYAGELEVLLALGPSRDRTDEVAASLAATDPRVRTVANPSGRTASGLNLALAATRARSEVVVRVDGHAVIPPDYVAAAVATLQRTGADNVGGVMAAQGQTDFEQAVACAMRSVLGVGAAAFHVGGTEGPAPTVYLGAFRRSALARVGGYDESFVRAQDWELNHRIIESGGLVWFTPAMQVTYRPRPNLRRLGRQYLEYGRWRRQITREHRGTISLRYLAAPTAVLGVGLGTTAGLVGLVGPAWLRWGFTAPAGYAALVLVGAALTGRDLPPAALVRLPAVLATMHGAWGVGFLTSPADLRAAKQ